MKNKLKDRRAETKQYEHDTPANFVLKRYIKYALDAAIDVVLPSKINRPVLSLSPNRIFFPDRCRPSDATNPYAAIPINGSGTPGWHKLSSH